MFFVSYVALAAPYKGVMLILQVHCLAASLLARRQYLPRW